MACPSPRPRARTLAPRGLLLLATVLASLALALPASAQQGAVTGQIVDKDGKAFPFADVFLEAEQGNYSNAVLSDEDGKFRIAPVPVGSYKLYAFASGFVSDKFEGIFVESGQTRTYTVRLLPQEQMVEVLTVDARLQDLVDVKKVEVSSSLGGDFVNKIPLQNKRIQDIVALFPGVVRSGSSDSSDISIGGGTGSQIGYRLNGANINDPLNGGALLDIPTAAIDSFKLITTGFSAKYGEQSTGIAEIVTKRGSNELEFSYGPNFRDSSLGAQAIPGLDKVQAFVDDLTRAEGTVLEQETLAGFQLLGLDHISTREDDHNPPLRHRIRHTISAGGPIVRDKVFFHSTLEVLRDDTASPYVNGTFKTDQTLYTGKVNWDVSDNDKLEISTNLDVSDDTGFSAPLAAPSTSSDTTTGTWEVAAKDTHIFSDTAFLESTLTVTQQYSSTHPADLRAGVGVRYRIPLPPGGPVNYDIGDAAFNQSGTSRQIRFETNLSKSLKGGKHALDAGFSASNLSFHSFQDNGPIVTDLRVVDDSAIISVPQLAGRVADFGPAVRTNDSTWSYAAYLSDAWQVTPNFTMNLGLRADYQAFVGQAFIAPRVGFSLDPIGDGKTRFFGNWGIYYDNLFANALQWTKNPDQITSNLLFADAYTAERRFSQTPITTIYKEALATGTRPPTSSDAVAYLQSLFRDTYVLSPDLIAPQNRQWAFGIERRLPANMRMQVSYTENKREHQIQQLVTTRREATQTGEFTQRDRILATNGEGKFQQWSGEIQKLFSNRWSLNFSYVWSRNTGPIAPPTNAIDPNDVVSENGLLGNDRTTVVKLQGTGRLPWKVDLGADFTWQAGTPLSADILTRQGTTFRPFGRNTLRLPPSRQLNLNLRRPFQTADGKLSIEAEVRVFNILNELNIFGGFGRFEVPEGTANPQAYPPLRPAVLPTDIDVGRSLELGMTIRF